MKKFIKIFKQDKDQFKMVNQTTRGFELIILSYDTYKHFVEKLDSFSSEDKLFLAWQMKHKRDHYLLYRNCVFTNPRQNTNTKGQIEGMRFTVTCTDIQYFADNVELRGRKAVPFVKGEMYKDAKLLHRMIKISTLDSNCADMNDEILTEE